MPRDLLAPLDELAQGVCRGVPPPVLVRVAEGVDHRQLPILVAGELLLPVDVYQARRLRPRVHNSVDLQAEFPYLFEFHLRDPGHFDRFRVRQMLVGLFELGGRLEERSRKGFPEHHHMVRREPELFRRNRLLNYPVPQRAVPIVSRDEFERNQVVFGLGGQLGVVSYDVHPLHAHRVGRGQLYEMGRYPCLLQLLEPEGARPGQDLSFVRYFIVDCLVECRNLIFSEAEFQLIFIQQVYFLDLS